MSHISCFFSGLNPVMRSYPVMQVGTQLTTRKPAVGPVRLAGFLPAVRNRVAVTTCSRLENSTAGFFLGGKLCHVAVENSGNVQPESIAPPPMR